MACSVVARKLDGWQTVVELEAGESAGDLKQRVLQALGTDLRPYQVNLAFEGKVLQDLPIETFGFQDGSEVLVSITPSMPAWAEERAFENSHCFWLREHFQGTSVEKEEWLSSDEVVWQRLQQAEDKHEEDRAAFRNYGCHLWLREHGQRVGQIRAMPGQVLDLEVEGWVWNDNRHSAIHQVGLATGMTHLAELYEGVPSTPQKVLWRGTITAPCFPGAHMLYSHQDLMYSWADAHKRFSERDPAEFARNECPPWGLPVYPDNFAGWLVVESATDLS